MRLGRCALLGLLCLVIIVALALPCPVSATAADTTYDILPNVLEFASASNVSITLPRTDYGSHYVYINVYSGQPCTIRLESTTGTLAQLMYTNGYYRTYRLRVNLLRGNAGDVWHMVLSCTSWVNILSIIAPPQSTVYTYPVASVSWRDSPAYNGNWTTLGAYGTGYKYGAGILELRFACDKLVPGVFSARVSLTAASDADITILSASAIGPNNAAIDYDVQYIFNDTDSTLGFTGYDFNFFFEDLSGYTSGYVVLTICYDVNQIGNNSMLLWLCQSVSISVPGNKSTDDYVRMMAFTLDKISADSSVSVSLLTQIRDLLRSIDSVLDDPDFADGFGQSSQTAQDDLQQSSNDLNKLNKPNIGSINMSQNVVNASSVAIPGNILSTVLSDSTMGKIVTLVVILATLGYILYGKK